MHHPQTRRNSTRSGGDQDRLVPIGHVKDNETKKFIKIFNKE